MRFSPDAKRLDYFSLMTSLAKLAQLN